EEGIVESQRNIAFNISQGSVELVSIYLHKLNLIEGSGDQLDHRTFRSKNLIEKKLPVTFPRRNEILDLMKYIQDERNVLCYGSRKPLKRVRDLIQNFRKLQKIIENPANKK
ncbi:MAG: hypothetical protein QF915_00585, partial [Candidatus Woesearchaeota archaeon]|nr:hypothetical protein [Candidatus Woesearchaeota archaeon]